MMPLNAYVNPCWEDLFFTYNIVLHGESGWMATEHFNSLFKIDMKTGILEWVAKFPLEPDMIKCLYRNYLLVEDKIYFAPVNASTIAIYDIKNNLFDNISLCLQKGLRNGNKALILQNGEDLILIGVCGTNQILKFNIKNKEIQYIFNGELENIDIDKYEMIYGFKACILHNKLYVPIYKQGKALVVDIQSKKNEIIKIAQDDVRLSMAISVDEQVWFVGNDGYIYIYNEKNSKISQIEIDVNKELYWTYARKGDLLWIYSHKRPGSIKAINIHTHKCEIERTKEYSVMCVCGKEENPYELCLEQNGVPSIRIRKDGQPYESKKLFLQREDGRNDIKCLSDYGVKLFSMKQYIYNEQEDDRDYRKLPLFLEWIIDNG